MTAPRPGTTATDRYHHGDLPNALRCAAADLIAEKGLAHFSLREVARRAGVSHAAPAHHFGDTTGLLTSVATQGFRHLAEACQAATVGIDDPEARLVAVGRAYVETGLRFPGYCQVMFRADVVDCGDPAYLEAAGRAYGILLEAVGGVVDAEARGIELEDAVDLCWSTMEGLLALSPSMARRSRAHGRPEPDLDQRITIFTQLLLEGLRNRD